jgi:hypothetical protein
LAFLNSAYAQKRLTYGHRPTPKGFYAVTEALLREIPIPPPSSKKTTTTVLELVSALITETDEAEIKRLEASLAKVVDGLMR